MRKASEKNREKNKKNKNSSLSVFLDSWGRDPSLSARPTTLGEASIFSESYAMALGKGPLLRELSKALGEDFFYF